MTLITYLNHNGEKYLAGDSQKNSTYANPFKSGQIIKSYTIAPKVFNCNNLILGFSGVACKPIEEYLLETDNNKSLSCIISKLYELFIKEGTSKNLNGYRSEVIIIGLETQLKFLFDYNKMDWEMVEINDIFYINKCKNENEINNILQKELENPNGLEIIKNLYTSIYEKPELHNYDIGGDIIIYSINTIGAISEIVIKAELNRDPQYLGNL